MAGLIRGTLVVAALAAATPTLADSLDKATQDSLQAVITQQLDALAHEDAEKAESFAAPGIKAKFPNPKDFATMVHNAYAPLLSPRSTHFEKAGTTALGPLQSMSIVDRNGETWMAVYTFEQVDGAWRINGCVLVKQPGTTV